MPRTPAVQFRLAHEDYIALSDKAKRFGVTPNIYAQELLRTVIHDDSRVRVMEELQSLQTKVRQLETQVESVTDSVETILTKNEDDEGGG